MRTKTLLLAAAAFAAGLMGASAQVYSQNIVGYINVTLKPGFNLIANQLNSSGSNTINSVLTGVPDGSLCYKFNPVTTVFSVDTYQAADAPGFPKGWYDNTAYTPSTTTLNPGDGFFLNSAAGTDVTLTLVGEVKTGQSTVTLYPGFSLVSSVVPASYQLLPPEFPATDGMLYYSYGVGGFTVNTYQAADAPGFPHGWYDNTAYTPAVSQPNVGQGFFINNPGASTPWTRTFTP